MIFTYIWYTINAMMIFNLPQTQRRRISPTKACGSAGELWSKKCERLGRNSWAMARGALSKDVLSWAFMALSINLAKIGVIKNWIFLGELATEVRCYILTISIWDKFPKISKKESLLSAEEGKNRKSPSSVESAWGRVPEDTNAPMERW